MEEKNVDWKRSNTWQKTGSSVVMVQSPLAVASSSAVGGADGGTSFANSAFRHSTGSAEGGGSLGRVTSWSGAAGGSAPTLGSGGLKPAPPPSFGGVALLLLGLLAWLLIIVSFMPAWYVATQDTSTITIWLFQYMDCTPGTPSGTNAQYSSTMSCIQWLHADAGTAFQYMQSAGGSAFAFSFFAVFFSASAGLLSAVHVVPALRASYSDRLPAVLKSTVVTVAAHAAAAVCLLIAWASFLGTMRANWNIADFGGPRSLVSAGAPGGGLGVSVVAFIAELGCVALAAMFVLLVPPPHSTALPPVSLLPQAPGSVVSTAVVAPIRHRPAVAELSLALAGVSAPGVVVLVLGVLAWWFVLISTVLPWYGGTLTPAGASYAYTSTLSLGLFFSWFCVTPLKVYNNPRTDPSHGCSGWPLDHVPAAFSYYYAAGSTAFAFSLLALVAIFAGIVLSAIHAVPFLRRLCLEPPPPVQPSKSRGPAGATQDTVCESDLRGTERVSQACAQTSAGDHPKPTQACGGTEATTGAGVASTPAAQQIASSSGSLDLPVSLCERQDSVQVSGATNQGGSVISASSSSWWQHRLKGNLNREPLFPAYLRHALAPAAAHAAATLLLLIAWSSFVGTFNANYSLTPWYAMYGAGTTAVVNPSGGVGLSIVAWLAEFACAVISFAAASGLLPGEASFRRAPQPEATYRPALSGVSAAYGYGPHQHPAPAPGTGGGGPAIAVASNSVIALPPAGTAQNQQLSPHYAAPTQPLSAPTRALTLAMSPQQQQQQSQNWQQSGVPPPASPPPMPLPV